jgi:hypothetical protein
MKKLENPVTWENAAHLTADQLRRLLPEDLEGPIQEIHYFLIGQNGYWDITDDRPRTLRACWEVLCRLPEKITQGIMYGDPVVLIAPERACWGRALPMSLPRAKFGWIYLAPELEDQSDRVIVAVVAHELAHVIIGDITGDESEKKADLLIREWGFSAELDALQKINPNHCY